MCTITCPITEAVPQRCFYKKLLFKHAAFYRKKTVSKCDFNKFPKQIY